MKFWMRLEMPNKQLIEPILIEYGIQQKGNYPNWKMAQFEYQVNARYTTLEQAKKEIEWAKNGFPYLKFRLIKITEIRELVN